MDSGRDVFCHRGSKIEFGVALCVRMRKCSTRCVNISVVFFRPADGVTTLHCVVSLLRRRIEKNV